MDNINNNKYIIMVSYPYYLLENCRCVAKDDAIVTLYVK